MERTHRQLGTGLTDRLRSDGADGLADVDELAGRHRATVVLGGDLRIGIGSQHGVDLELFDAVGHEHVHHSTGDIGLGRKEHIALGVGDIGDVETAVDAGLGVLVRNQVALVIAFGDRQGDALVRLGLCRTDDDILRDVDETTGQVTGVSGTQSGIGQTLTSTVRSDEVLEHCESLTVVRHDRTRDDLTLRVRHQTAHTGQLTHLHPVTGCTGLDQTQHRVLLGEVRAHDLVDLLGRLGPQLDELVAALVIGQRTQFVLLLNLRVDDLGIVDDLGLRLG